jgi:hypothetical protein
MTLRRWRLDNDRRHSDDDHIGTAAAAQDGRTAAAHRCSSQGRRQRCRDVDGALTQLSGLDSDWFYGAGVGTWMGGELKCDCCNGLWWSSREDDESGGPVMASAAPALREDLRVRNRTLTLIEREDDTRSWGNFLVYFSHSTTMPYPPRGWGYILIGC